MLQLEGIYLYLRNEIKLMKKILFISTALILLSCVSLKKNISSTIKFEFKDYLTYEKIELHKDSTFNYDANFEMTKLVSKGKWKAKNGSFILNSFDEYKSNLIEVKESINNQKNLKFKLLDKDGRILDFVSIVINNIEYEFDLNGELTIDEISNLSYFRVNCLGTIYEHKILNKSTNNFEIILYEMNNNHYFKEKSFKLYNNYIKIDNKKYFLTTSPR